MTGVVTKSTGSWFNVRGENGEIYPCRVKGKLRLEEFRETSPAAVGDFVTFELEQAEGAAEGVIASILPRKNHMVRRSVKQSSLSHVLAANIDQALLLVTTEQPRTSTGFIDRFLVSAEAYSITQILVFNKKDLLSETNYAFQQNLIGIYQSLGVTCLETCALEDAQPEINSIIKGKTSLFTGHSGTGKSTLLNKLSPDITQKTGAISASSVKGVHTTTFAEMFKINGDTFVIDTPGIKEWGLSAITPEELSDNFPEMRDVRSKCKFGYRCLHFEEPQCAVVEKVRRGEIALSRYENYLSMLRGEDNRR